MSTFNDRSNSNVQEFCQKTLLTNAEMESKIDLIIKENGLAKEDHPFFVFSRELNQAGKMAISPEIAFNIARHWGVMTKAFMFTTLASVGQLSYQLSSQNEIPAAILSALQTGVTVISDDLTNHHPAFRKVAPKGPCGVHYQWWNTTITAPLAKHLAIDRWTDLPISANITNLIQGMHELAVTGYGFAIQLRLVEAIALFIAIAFRDIFTNTVDQSKKIFSERSAINWITAHIKAEVNHHADVSDLSFGMASLAQTPEEQDRFLIHINRYAALWSLALTDFYHFLTVDK